MTPNTKFGLLTHRFDTLATRRMDILAGIRSHSTQKGWLAMKSLLVLIIGLPLAAAVGLYTSMAALWAMGCLFMIALWVAENRQHQA
jgi:hypothetical protein